MLSPAKLRRFCLGLPGAVEEFPFRPGLSVFKVSGKVFALSPLGDRPLRVSLKCEPALAEQLRDTYSAIRPGYTSTSGTGTRSTSTTACPTGSCST